MYKGNVIEQNYWHIKFMLLMYFYCCKDIDDQIRSFTTIGFMKGNTTLQNVTIQICDFALANYSIHCSTYYGNTIFMKNTVVLSGHTKLG